MVDLEAPIGKGLFVKDILHHATQGSLRDKIPSVVPELTKVPSKDIPKEFMQVDVVLDVTGLLKLGHSSVSSAEVKKLRRGAII